MQPILISFSVILFGVIGATLLFSVAMRGRSEEEKEDQQTKTPVPTGHFFWDEVAGPLRGFPLPPDVLRLQLEEHVRTEKKAAEGFLRSPSADSLQAPSTSPFRR